MNPLLYLFVSCYSPRVSVHTLGQFPWSLQMRPILLPWPRDPTLPLSPFLLYSVLSDKDYKLPDRTLSHEICLETLVLPLYSLNTQSKSLCLEKRCIPTKYSLDESHYPRDNTIDPPTSLQLKSRTMNTNSESRGFKLGYLCDSRLNCCVKSLGLVVYRNFIKDLDDE